MENELEGKTIRRDMSKQGMWVLRRVRQENKFITGSFNLQVDKLKSAHFKPQRKTPNLLTVITGKARMTLDLLKIEQIASKHVIRTYTFPSTSAHVLNSPCKSSLCVEELGIFTIISFELRKCK